MACQTANCLFMKDPEIGKPLLNYNLINSLNELSKNGWGCCEQRHNIPADVLKRIDNTYSWYRDYSSSIYNCILASHKLNLISNICFLSIKVSPQIQESRSSASLQPLVRKGLAKLPEKSELKVNPECQDLSVFGCVLSVSYPVCGSTPLSGICEKQRDTDWWIRQCCLGNAQWVVMRH